MTTKQRDKYLKRKYGIGVKEYNRMFEAQQGKCAVCQRPPKKGKNLHVDHDHKSGEVRGLLDYYCNRRVIGRNNEDTIKKLVAYLMPNYDLKLNIGNLHHEEILTRYVTCNCLICVREEINYENKLCKSRS